MIGNAHLDPAWMWTWDEGMEAFLATCRSALERMEENGDFIFTCSSAAHYAWVERVEPDLFEAIRRRVAEGRWCIVGGWWTQADCNIPSGEGFVRQALLGQRYFLRRFGRRALTGYSPDAFGHNGGLPQLLAKSGMNGYIFCRPDPTELTLPSPLIRWYSPDGSSVLAYRVPFHYNMYESSVPKKVDDIATAFRDGSNLAAGDVPLAHFSHAWGIFYGVGNHGGGPTREHIAQIVSIGNDAKNTADTSSSPLRMIFSDPDTFLAEVAEHSEEFPLPEWHHDLQLNAPGCYSAHSLIKQLNRRSEHELPAAEKFATLASTLLGDPFPLDDLRRAWERVCFNHFHDILCGVAIREALDDAVATYGEALAVATDISRISRARIARAIDTRGAGQTLIVFNPHAWDIEEYVTFELWHDIDKSLWSEPVDLRITDDDGNEVATQGGYTSGKIGRDRVAFTFQASLPAYGWRCWRVHYGEKSNLAVSAHTNTNDTTLENEFLRIEFSPESGAITRLYDKRIGSDILTEGSALPMAIADSTDTWGHGVEKFDQILGDFGNAEVRLVESGPTHATIRVKNRWRSSWVQQDFRLYYNSDVVHVRAKIFWAEEHLMLKLNFRTEFEKTESWYEGAYTATHYPCDGVERPGGSWCAFTGELQGGQQSIILANNAKHSYSANGSDFAVTLLRSPSYATHDPHPHHPDEELDYLDQGPQRFDYTLSIATTLADTSNRDWLTTAARRAAIVNIPPIPLLESAHDGNNLPRHYTGARATPSNVLVTIIKRSESDDGWIVRLFETTGESCEATLHLNIIDAEWSGAIRGFEVITLHFSESGVREVDLVEG
jgi:alpha-mannosidase